MWCPNVILVLLFFELHINGLHCLPKETHNREAFELKPGEIVEFINTKQDEPMIREIFLYHFLEKPYLENSHENPPENQEPEFDVSLRPFTNGQGYQFLDAQLQKPTEKGADKEDIKIMRVFSVDANDTKIPLHVGNTDKDFERILAKNKKHGDESTKSIDSLNDKAQTNRRKRNAEFQPVMVDTYRSGVYTNPPKYTNTDDKPFQNKVRNLFKNLATAKKRGMYGMSLHNGVGNIWNNIPSMPFIHEIGSQFSSKLHTQNEIPIEKSNDAKAMINEYHKIPPYILNQEIPPAPKILEPRYKKRDATRKPNISTKSQDTDTYSNLILTSEKYDINHDNIYINKNDETSNEDRNMLPKNDDLIDDKKPTFVNKNNIQSNKANKTMNLPHVKEIDNSQDIPININDNTKEKNENNSIKHITFYEKLKESFKMLLHKLLSSNQPFVKNIHEIKVKDNIPAKSIPSTLQETNAGTYGMRLKNNGGLVWNDLDPKHTTFINVGDNPFVDKMDKTPTDTSTHTHLSHFDDNIEITKSPTTTNIHTKKETELIETTTQQTTQMTTEIDNSFVAKNLTTQIRPETSTVKGEQETETVTTVKVTTPESTIPAAKNQTTDDILSPNDIILTTTEEIVTTAKQFTYNNTKTSTEKNNDITTEYERGLSHIITTTGVNEKINKTIDTLNAGITTQTSRTNITDFNKATEKTSEPNLNNSTETTSNESTITTTKSPDQDNNRTTEAQQSKNFDKPKNDTKRQKKEDSIKSDLNKLLEKKVFWDWLTAWTSSFFEVFDENVKKIVKQEVALEIKNVTEFLKNEHEVETSSKPEVQSPIISKTTLNSTKVKENQNVTTTETTSESSASKSGNDIKGNQNSKNVSGVYIAGDTINGKTVDVTNIFIFLNDNQSNILKPIVNKTLVDLNNVKDQNTSHSQHDYNQNSSTENHQATTTMNFTDLSEKNNISAASDLTEIKTSTTEKSTVISNTTTTDVLTTTHPQKQNITATTISAILTTTDKISKINATSVTESSNTKTTAANLTSAEITTLTPLTEDSTATTKNVTIYLNATKIETQTVSSNTTTLLPESRITASTTESSTMALNNNSNQTTIVPLIQNNITEPNTINNTSTTTVPKIEEPSTMHTSSDNGSTEATRTTLSQSITNFTREQTIANETLVNTIKESNLTTSNITTVSGKELNVTTEATTRKESVGTLTTNSEEHATTVSTFGNNSTNKDISMTNITATIAPNSLTNTDSLKVERSTN